MRPFFAIMLPDELRRELHRAQRAIEKSCGAGLRFLDSESLHLTVKFLGECDEGFLSRLAAAADSVCANILRFSLSLSNFGTFPPSGRLNIVWAGLSDPPGLAACAAQIDACGETLGFSLETRPFSPHITIARAKARPADNLRDFLAGLTTAALPFTPPSLSLVRSQPGPSGSKYTVVHEARFA